MKLKHLLLLFVVGIAVSNALANKEATKPSKKTPGKSAFDIESSLPKKPNVKGDSPSLLDEFKERVVTLSTNTHYRNC
jgi:hypothetical protein